MKIVIFGATGIVGKSILKEALAQQHDVTVLTRDARKINIKNNRLTVMEGNVFDRPTLQKVLQEQDAVIQSLGIDGKGNGQPTTLVSDANKLIVEEIQKTPIKRYIALSVIGAGNSIAFLPWIFTKVLLPFFMKWFQAIIDDKNRMEPAIINSHLDWTIVRGTTVTDKPATGQAIASLDGKGLKFNITASDLAKFIVTELTDCNYLKQAPTVSN